MDGRKSGHLIAFIVGILIGFAGLIGVRMALVKDTKPHYHADFAVYVDGQRLKYEGPTFYQEVNICSTAGPNDPLARAHMHNNNDHVIHVHDYVVTWSDFFANLRYGLSDKSLALDDKVLVDGNDGKKLTFWLNGQPVDHIANKVIGDQDRLLISYGNADQAALKKQFNSVQNDAKTFDEGSDPASCSGEEKLMLSKRFKRAFTVNQIQ